MKVGEAGGWVPASYPESVGESFFSWDGWSDLQPHLQALTSCSCWGLDTPISPSPLPLNLRLRTEGRYADVRLRRNGDYLPFTTNA